MTYVVYEIYLIIKNHCMRIINKILTKKKIYNMVCSYILLNKRRKIKDLEKENGSNKK